MGDDTNVTPNSNDKMNRARRIGADEAIDYRKDPQ
jgi:hypothetical protein